MNVKGQYSLEELRLLFRHEPDRIRFEMLIAADHEARLRHVEAAIDWIAQEHAKTPQHRHKRDEDELTTDLITDLKAMGFDASHDKDYGGHADIVIEARENFLWLAEAKIHRDYAWLLKGFQQLDTRYSTGLPGQDTGSLIIYCKRRRVDLVMDRWCEELARARPDVSITVCAENPLIRRSSHRHERTGLLFRVRHVPISIYFKPDDRS